MSIVSMSPFGRFTVTWFLSLSIFAISTVPLSWWAITPLGSLVPLRSVSIFSPAPCAPSLLFSEMASDV